MSDVKHIFTKSRPDGLKTSGFELSGKVLDAKTRELVGFLQTLCDSDEVLALAVLQTALDSLKQMWCVEGEVTLTASENPLQ